MQEVYTVEGDGYRCSRHALVFSRLSVCDKCLTDPPRLDLDADDEDLPPPPKGCLSTEQLESRLIGLAEFTEEEARAALREVDAGWHRFGAGTKLIDSAIKAFRAAGAYATNRESEIVVARRVKALRSLMGRVSH